jgi:hypothetical protein
LYVGCACVWESAEVTRGGQTVWVKAKVKARERSGQPGARRKASSGRGSWEVHWSRFWSADGSGRRVSGCVLAWDAVAVVALRAGGRAAGGASGSAASTGDGRQRQRQRQTWCVVFVAAGGAAAGGLGRVWLWEWLWLGRRGVGRGGRSRGTVVGAGIGVGP